MSEYKKVEEMAALMVAIFGEGAFLVVERGAEITVRTGWRSDRVGVRAHRMALAIDPYDELYRDMRNKEDALAWFKGHEVPRLYSIIALKDAQLQGDSDE